MEKNVGKTDMITRIVLGIIIIGLGIYFKSWLGIIGVIPLATAGMNYCPLYSIFKINTKK